MRYNFAACGIINFFWFEVYITHTHNKYYLNIWYMDYMSDFIFPVSKRDRQFGD